MTPPPPPPPPQIHLLEIKALTKQNPWQVDNNCLIHRLRRRGALKEAHRKVHLKGSPLFLRKHGHFSEQRVPVVWRALHALRGFLILSMLSMSPRWFYGEVSTSREEDPGMAPLFGRSLDTSNLETGTLVAKLPDIWRYRVGAMRGVTVSMSAFLACHQCYCAGSSLA